MQPDYKRKMRTWIILDNNFRWRVTPAGIRVVIVIRIKHIFDWIIRCLRLSITYRNLSWPENGTVRTRRIIVFGI